MNESGDLLDQFRFTHDQDGFDLLHNRIERIGPSEQVLAAIETKHGLLVHNLLRSGYTVYAINPKAVDRYKDRLRASKTKDDKLDARTLADLLRTDRHLHRPLRLGPDDYRLLQQMCKDLGVLIDDATRLGNRLLESLKEWYPAAVGVFGQGSDIFLELLTAYPTPKRVETLTEDQFKAFLKKHGYSVPSRAHEAFQQLKRRTPSPDPVALAAGPMKAKAIVEQLKVLRSSIKAYDKQIKELLDSLPEAEIISSLPGVGKRLAPEITAMFGPNMEDAPKRFEQAKDLSALAGLAPITRQSGKFKVAIVRFSCDHWMRRTARNWAGASIKESSWARAFYDWHRKQKAGHETILRKLAAKWVKIAFHLWRTGERYDEQKHISALKARKVVWATSL
jgi:transposase